MAVDRARLRQWTIDANDGIIATAGVLEGFAGAGASESQLIAAAVIASLAGGLSMGGAMWAEESAEREAQLRLIAEEQEQLTLNPEEEVAELTLYYEERGVDHELAVRVAEQLSAKDALAAQLESEHGIREVMSRSAPVVAGGGSALAYMLGASVPLLISILVSGRIEIWAILVAVIGSLTITSIIGARQGGTTVWRTLARSLVVGIGTLGISYLAGLLLF